MAHLTSKIVEEAYALQYPPPGRASFGMVGVVDNGSASKSFKSTIFQGDYHIGPIKYGFSGWKPPVESIPASVLAAAAVMAVAASPEPVGRRGFFGRLAGFVGTKLL